MAMSTSEPLLRQLVVAATGPVVTAILGSLLVGLFAQWVARKVQDQRDASTIRRQLVSDLTEVAGASSLELNAFGRLRGRLTGRRSGYRSRRRLASAREVLDRQHFDSRVRGWVLERRLEIHYGEGSRASLEWHKTLDALHLAYLRLVEMQVDAELENQMLEHMGLPDERIGSAPKDIERLLEASESGLKGATGSVLKDPMLITAARGRRNSSAVHRQSIGPDSR
jgi:predicted DNA-binding ArsR family transcriptional regulator